MTPKVTLVEKVLSSNVTLIINIQLKSGETQHVHKYFEDYKM